MGLNFLNYVRSSFRVKVIVTSIAIILFICFALTAFYVHHQGVAMNNALVERGGLLARVLAHSAKVGVFSENIDLLRAPVDGIAQQQEVTRVSVYNADGIPLYTSTGRREDYEIETYAPVVSRIESELYERLGASPSPIYLNSKDTLQVWSTVFATPGYAKAESLFLRKAEFQGASTVIGFINLTISKEMLDKALFGFLFKALLMAAAATLIGSLLIFIVIKGVTSPLNRLAGGIKALGTDDEVEAIPVDTQDEIGRLAIAFNELSESLRRRKAENVQLEMQLRQSQKLEALGTLAGGIAHDFNNVLSPIFGYTEMVMEDVADNALLHRNLQQVLYAAKRARELVRQILAFSRQSETQRMPIRVQVVLKEALKLLRASLPTTITITRRIDENCGPVLADPTNIHQIVMNLCTNAYHAMKDRGGKLKVSLEEVGIDDEEKTAFLNLPPGRYLKLSISDTGVGMDDSTLQRIFDPYFTTKPVGEGTGMGLAMVHGIVKGCGGHTIVESQPGKGTDFHVYLPRAQHEAASGCNFTVQSIPRGKERILLVDDEAQIAYMLKQMLEQLGYRVSVRTSSLEALEAFAAHPDRFDVIITDQTMPNMTGDLLAAEALKLRADIPVILCTGFSESITEENARKRGVRALLVKPVLKKEMAEAIRNVLNETRETPICRQG